MTFKTLEWKDGLVRLLDQLKLPAQEVYVEVTDAEGIYKAIQEMVIRGAPAIGVAAAFGIALNAYHSCLADLAAFKQYLRHTAQRLVSARPTAVNLSWAVNRMVRLIENEKWTSVKDLRQALITEAHQIYESDIEINKRIGSNGSPLLSEGDGVLTHCNAGALATAGFGTALGVIRTAHLEGKILQVYADETRPYLQGARLTTWELHQDGIDVTLITDNMAGYFMQQGAIQKVIVGADRIACNGDAANKIGTYSLACLAHLHQIPFYIAAPVSTFDFSIPDGSHIIIEERNSDEVVFINNKRIAPEGVKVRHPSFDVTPHRFISAFITEKGVIYPPFQDTINRLTD